MAFQMKVLLWLVAIFLVNPFIGGVVMALIDDEEKNLFHWMESCPKEIEWFAPYLVMCAWPVVLCMWLLQPTRPRPRPARGPE